MRLPRSWVASRVIIVALLLGALIVSPVLAATVEDEETVIEFTGTVVADPEAELGCALVVSVNMGESESQYTVQTPADFDCAGVAEGDTVEVEGTLDEDGVTVVATKVVVESEDEEIEFTGTVSSVTSSEAGCTLVVVVETDDGEIEYTVEAPAEFDCADVKVGDTVEVEGTLSEDDIVLATKVVVESEDEEIEFTGTVSSVTSSEAGCTLVVVVETDDGEIEYTVEAPAEFDCASVEAGDTVEVEGTLSEDDIVVATKVVVESEDDEDEDEDEDGKVGGCFCRDLGFVHPVGLGLARLYDVSYEQVMTWFCDGVGFGQIMHALQTAKVIEARDALADDETDEETDEESDETDDLSALAETYLARRAAGEGWGQIWQDEALKGKAAKAIKAEIKAEKKVKVEKAVKGKPGKPAKPAKPPKPAKPGKSNPGRGNQK